MTVSKLDLAAAKATAEELESDVQGLLRFHAWRMATEPGDRHAAPARGDARIYFDVKIPPKMRDRLAVVAERYALPSMLDAIRLVVAEAGRRRP